MDHPRMGTEIEMARAALGTARQMFIDNVTGVSIDEALDPAGGFRSIVGLMKHTAAWTAVYYSYAFDETPRTWEETNWPRGLRSTIDSTDGYLREVLAWFERGSQWWLEAIDHDIDLDEPRPTHWGDILPLREIVAYVVGHMAYHAGEINMILSIRRGEAWEYGEHVEENHIGTLGHSVRREWDTDEAVEQFEDEMRRAAGLPPGSTRGR
jgi:uncharacterized damage-inducible protein DinB